MKRFFSLVALLFIFSNAHAAEIANRFGENPCLFSGIDINGPIENGDSKKFRALLLSFKKKLAEHSCTDALTYVKVNSTGGSVEEAMEIGFEIRKNTFGVIIPQSQNCFSSCVLILAAGVHKLVGGSVGIHRPYFSNLKAGQSLEEVRRIRDAMNARIKSYLNFVDIPTALLDEMLAYPPENIKILTNEELLKYRLTGKDATKDEIDTAEQASFFGLSSSEYRQRYQVFEKKCAHLIQDFSNISRAQVCQFSVMLNVNDAEVERRLAKARKNCLQLPEQNFRPCFRHNIINPN